MAKRMQDTQTHIILLNKIGWKYISKVSDEEADRKTEYKATLAKRARKEDAK